MVAVPVPTVAPQDAWYMLTTGPVNPSQADSVPNAALLSYNTTTQTTGVVGALDGAVIYLAGTTTELDGGQKWLMWQAASLATPDNTNIFNPFASNSTPGRWVTAQTPVVIAGGQIVMAGSTVAILPSTAPIVNVIVNKTVGSATTLNPPINPNQWQEFSFKDGKGDAATNPITISPLGGQLIDGAPTIVIAVNYGFLKILWDGSTWRVKG